jgi:predicted DNA-binding transcriptional regulator AlpA
MHDETAGHMEPIETPEMSRILIALEDYPLHAIISVYGVAQALGVSVRSIDRYIVREQLPPPVELGNARVWTVAILSRHIRLRCVHAASRQREAMEQAVRDLQDTPAAERRITQLRTRIR